MLKQRSIALATLVLFALCQPAFGQSPGSIFIQRHAQSVAGKTLNLFRHLNEVNIRNSGEPLHVTPDTIALLMAYIGAHRAERSLVIANAQVGFAYFRMLSARGLDEARFPGVEPRRTAAWHFAERYFEAAGQALPATWAAADLILRYTGGDAHEREWIAAVLDAYREHRRLVQAVEDQSPLRSHRPAVNPPPHYQRAMIGRCAAGYHEACAVLYPLAASRFD